MIDKDLCKKILDEQDFPYMGMTLEERNYYLNIIKNCKDIADTIHKVGNKSQCRILKLSLKKKENEISFNGFATIEHENRCIDGYLFLEKDSILVDMHITRLCVDDIHKEYTVLDEFKLVDDILKRKSRYNYDRHNYCDSIKDELLKGRER